MRRKSKLIGLFAVSGAIALHGWAPLFSWADPPIAPVVEDADPLIQRARLLVKKGEPARKPTVWYKPVSSRNLTDKEFGKVQQIASDAVRRNEPASQATPTEATPSLTTSSPMTSSRATPSNSNAAVQRTEFQQTAGEATLVADNVTNAGFVGPSPVIVEPGDVPSRTIYDPQVRHVRQAAEQPASDAGSKVERPRNAENVVEHIMAPSSQEPESIPAPGDDSTPFLETMKHLFVKLKSGLENLEVAEVTRAKAASEPVKSVETTKVESAPAANAVPSVTSADKVLTSEDAAEIQRAQVLAAMRRALTSSPITPIKPAVDVEPAKLEMTQVKPSAPAAGKETKPTAQSSAMAKSASMAPTARKSGEKAAQSSASLEAATPAATAAPKLILPDELVEAAPKPAAPQPKPNASQGPKQTDGAVAAASKVANAPKKSNAPVSIPVAQAQPRNKAVQATPVATGPTAAKSVATAAATSPKSMPTPTQPKAPTPAPAEVKTVSYEAPAPTAKPAAAATPAANSSATTKTTVETTQPTSPRVKVDHSRYANRPKAFSGVQAGSLGGVWRSFSGTPAAKADRMESRTVVSASTTIKPYAEAVSEKPVDATPKETPRHDAVASATPAAKPQEKVGDDKALAPATTTAPTHEAVATAPPTVEPIADAGAAMPAVPAVAESKSREAVAPPKVISSPAASKPVQAPKQTASASTKSENVIAAVQETPSSQSTSSTLGQADEVQTVIYHGLPVLNDSAIVSPQQASKTKTPEPPVLTPIAKEPPVLKIELSSAVATEPDMTPQVQTAAVQVQPTASVQRTPPAPPAVRLSAEECGWIIATSKIDADRERAMAALTTIEHWDNSPMALDALIRVALTDYNTAMRRTAVEMLCATTAIRGPVVETLKLSSKYDADESIRRTAAAGVARFTRPVPPASR